MSPDLSSWCRQLAHKVMLDGTFDSSTYCTMIFPTIQNHPGWAILPDWPWKYDCGDRTRKMWVPEKDEVPAHWIYFHKGMKARETYWGWNED